MKINCVITINNVYLSVMHECMDKVMQTEPFESGTGMLHKVR